MPRRGIGDRARDLSRSMSRSLSALVQGTGRAVRREARAVAHAGRPSLPPGYTPPPGDLPPFRRSRIRIRARKWRLSRVQANPIGYAIGMMSIIGVLISILVSSGAGSVYAYNVYTMHKGDIQSVLNTAVSGQSTQIFDRNGRLLYTVKNDSGYSYYAPLSQIGKNIQTATLDIEDRSFYAPTNIGVDFQGTARALLADLKAGGAAQGGSTITQQLVKNMVLRDSDKAIQRKLNEFILAIGVNANYSKQQILEMYLNTIDYGDQNKGIEAAARNYFGLQPKTVNGKLVLANEQLSIAQAALLAGLPNAPTYYLPIQYSCDKAPCTDDKWANPCANDPREAVCIPASLEQYDWSVNGHEWLDWRRARMVLNAMLGYGDITQQQYDQSLQEVHDMLQNQQVKHWAGQKNGSVTNTVKNAPHFVDYVLDELANQWGVDVGNLATAGWKIVTTLDLSLDEYVAKNIDYYINKNHAIPSPDTYGRNTCGPGCELPLKETANANNGAAVAIDPRTGDILAMVGSVSYTARDPRVAGAVNVTTSVNRKMGSSVKGIVYATAFQMGWTPATMVQDAPVCFPNSTDSTERDDAAPACKGWYIPHNYSPNSWSGYAPVRFALANSLNTGATEALQFVGGAAPETAEDFLTMAQRLGITTLQQRAMGPTTALGDQPIPLLQLTGAYATFANQGRRAPPRAILRIEDSAGNVWQAPAQPKSEQVISPQAAFMLSSVLSDNKARAADFNIDNPLAFPEYPGIQIAAKTGTGSGKNGPSDIVTVGYSPYLAVGAWVGNSNGEDMTAGVIGIAGAGYIFHDVMHWAIKNYKWPPNSTFSVPPQMTRGVFGCGMGLAPYKDEKPGKCTLRNWVNNSTKLYYGYEPGTGGMSKMDVDWYIQGQEPQVS